MSMIGLDILHGFSKFIGDYWVGETSSAGTVTTMVDDKLSRFGDDALVDFYVRPIQDQNIYEVRRLDSFISSSGTMTFAPAYTVAPQIYQKYELHRYDPAIKYQCIDEARYRVIDDLFKIVYDETLTGDGHSNSFDIPSSVRHGPVRVYEETPIGTNNTWNLLNTADLDALTNWTATNFTATLEADSTSDVTVPKYRDSCTRLYTTGSAVATYVQDVANMSSVTASSAAGRKMTFGVWVYYRGFPSAQSVYASIVSNSSDAIISQMHTGNGWELLIAEGDIEGKNSTTLQVKITAETDSQGTVIFAERAWFYFGDASRITDRYDTLAGREVRRDNTIQRIYLNFIPNAGNQLRLEGRDYISSLGTGTAQNTRSTEVDGASAQILYGAAAQILFEREGMSAESMEQLSNRIALADRRKSEVKDRMFMPSAPSVKSAYE
jgi:hypothetical protein